MMPVKLKKIFVPEIKPDWLICLCLFGVYLIHKFYEKHGEEATREAFGVDRKLISKWRKRLKENSGRLEALIPHSTRPKRARKSKIPYPRQEAI